MSTANVSRYNPEGNPELNTWQAARLKRLSCSPAREDFRKPKAAVEGLSHLTALIADKDTTIRGQRHWLFPLVTERKRELLEPAPLEWRGLVSGA